MAALSPAAQDRLLLLSLGLATCGVIGLMRRMLVYYREAAAVTTESKPQYITQAVEDSLKLTTLNKLLDSSNYGIQETTEVLICERALHDGTTIDLLLYHITRPDHNMREQGIRALTMMLNKTTVDIINKPKTYAALVKSLQYSITDYRHHEYDMEWDNWHLRDVVEQGCLLVLIQMIDKAGVEGLVKSRFVDHWLSKEPWGGADDDERQLNFMNSLTKHYRLNELCLPLFRDEAGRKQLEDAKLLPANKIVYDDTQTVTDTRMINGESTAGEDFDGMFAEGRRRRDQSTEEEHLRRRNREAMVLNDGTRPLGRGDIIQRER